MLPSLISTIMVKPPELPMPWMAGGTITSPTASGSLSSSRWMWVTIERRSWPFSFSRAPQSFRIT